MTMFVHRIFCLLLTHTSCWHIHNSRDNQNTRG